jgi:mevalonate kinase
MGNYTNHQLDHIKAAIHLLAIEKKVGISGIKISLTSNLPASSGLSSSAAAIIATLHALNKYYKLDLSIFKICGLAYKVEKYELKTGAGQMDMYACGLGGLMCIDNSKTPPNISKYDYPNDLRIIIADTLTPKDTSKVIKQKRERYEKKEKTIVEYEKRTREKIELMKKFFETKDCDLQKLGCLVNDCHSYIRDYMQVSTDLVEKCISAGLSGGALGAKLTGAGMGGCVLFLAREENIENIEKKLKKLPVKVYEAKLSKKGLI